MTCGPVATTFRILDRNADWQLDLVPGAGVALGDVIELAQLDPAAIDPDALAGVMPPPWIARGCEPCEWYIACPPHTVLRYTPCTGWRAIAGGGCHVELVEPVAVAAAHDVVAILDAGRGELLLLSAGGERVIAAIPTPARGPIAFAGTAILVADGTALAAYDRITLARRDLPLAPGPIARLAVARGVVWAAIAATAALDLVRLADGACRENWSAAPLAELVATARPTDLVAAGPDGACLAMPDGGAEPRVVCIDRCGRPAEPPPDAPGPARAKTGSITTLAPLDSGMPRCRWHRVRIEVELPERTNLAIALVTVEDLAVPVADADWQVVDVARTGTDFLIDQPPGRYLRLRLDLRGDGVATPRVHHPRLDFPRSTSATRLPGVYREDPIAADFLERFVATFDASIEELDRVIDRFPALIDPAAAPADALAWLGSFLDIALDPSWPEATRRAILAEAPELYRRRGTPWALARAVELVTGTTPAIQELGSTSPFARIGRFRVGSSRLFGRARARFRLGASAIGSAPLRSYGDPDRDHVAALGWRITVQVPALSAPDALGRLRRLVDAQKPAHVAAAVRAGGSLALLGIESAVGIDTRLGGLPLPRLGSNTHLRRRTVLARGASRGRAGISVGVASALAIQTVLS